MCVSFLVVRTFGEMGDLRRANQDEISQDLVTSSGERAGGLSNSGAWSFGKVKKRLGRRAETSLVLSGRVPTGRIPRGGWSVTLARHGGSAAAFVWRSEQRQTNRRARSESRACRDQFRESTGRW